MVRTALAIPALLVVTLLLGILCVPVGLVDRSGAGIHAIVRAWSRLCLGLTGIEVRVSGLASLPQEPVVFVVNHASALDIPIVFGWLPVGFRVIHKRSLYALPLVGWCLYLGGHIGIDRKSPFRARHSLAAAAARIRGGTSVVVFPEGTRSRDGTVGLFKRGSFLLALNAGVPVVPVSLAGVKRVAPRGLLSLTAGVVSLKVHAAVPTDGRAPEEAEALAEEIREAVVRGIREQST